MQSPLEELRSRVQSKLTESPSPDFSSELARLLALSPGEVTSADDAARFIHLLAVLCQHAPPQAKAWDWAMELAARYPSHPGVLSLVASLGDQLRNTENSPLVDAIQPADLEEMIRLSMELDPDGPGSFARAGTYFLNQGNDAEAQRCFARAFQLDQSSSFIALRLAEIDSRLDRMPDALDVLDACIREGQAERDVFWQASLLASTLGRHESALRYLDSIEVAQPGAKWVQFYRSTALLDLKRFAEAADAIEQEAARLNIPTALHVHTSRAAAAAGLGHVDAVHQHIAAAVDTPLGIVNYLSRASIMSCYVRLWSAAMLLPKDDTARQRLEDRLLASGLTPAGFWDHHRELAEKTPGLNHYWCELRQAVDARWSDQGCSLPGQEKWKAYRIQYGVLASDEADARRQIVDWQSRSAPLPPTVESITLDGGPYIDRPGVTQRGYPQEAE
jgi:tetratricopeptide (TPR) repeat protein